ncbi:MAG: D-alanyl-D-alanine carboxypeptidase family protein [Alsobacter sp.]
MQRDESDRQQAYALSVRWILSLVVPLLVILSPLAAEARTRGGGGGAYAPPVSAMVLDPVTGKALYEQDADGPRHPASLTKVMTLYLLFEDLQKGTLRLDTPLTASWKAINQAPSRLGLQKGETITVEDAIRAIVTRSANDVAYVVAENVGGTDAAFIERMNATARRLGMTRTTFANPTGLPDRSQITTARDLVTLGRAIRDDFPALFSYFSLRTFDYGGKTILSHNRLMAKLQGMDGIKTGFTNASGFNLLASVRRDGRSVIAVVMGGSTQRLRDARMAELVEKTLPLAALAPPPPAEPPVVLLDDFGFHRGGLPDPAVEAASIDMAMAEPSGVPDWRPWRTLAGLSALAFAAAAGFAWSRRDWPLDLPHRLAGLVPQGRPFVPAPIREVAVLPVPMTTSLPHGSPGDEPLPRAVRGPAGGSRGSHAIRLAS